MVIGTGLLPLLPTPLIRDICPKTFPRHRFYFLFSYMWDKYASQPFTVASQISPRVTILPLWLCILATNAFSLSVSLQCFVIHIFLQQCLK